MTHATELRIAYQVLQVVLAKNLQLLTQNRIVQQPAMEVELLPVHLAQEVLRLKGVIRLQARVEALHRTLLAQAVVRAAAHRRPRVILQAQVLPVPEAILLVVARLEAALPVVAQAVVAQVATDDNIIDKTP
jgi:hypothetical protein